MFLRSTKRFKAGGSWKMISVTIPKEGEKVTPETFKWKLDWDRIREARANVESRVRQRVKEIFPPQLLITPSPKVTRPVSGRVTTGRREGERFAFEVSLLPTLPPCHCVRQGHRREARRVTSERPSPAALQLQHYASTLLLGCPVKRHVRKCDIIRISRMMMSQQRELWRCRVS